MPGPQGARPPPARLLVAAAEARAGLSALSGQPGPPRPAARPQCARRCWDRPTRRRVKRSSRAAPRSPASPRRATAAWRCPRTRRPSAPPGEPLPPTRARLLRQQPGSPGLRAAHEPRSVSRATEAPARRLAAHPRSERSAQLARPRPPVHGAPRSLARLGERPEPRGRGPPPRPQSRPLSGPEPLPG